MLPALLGHHIQSSQSASLGIHLRLLEEEEQRFLLVGIRIKGHPSPSLADPAQKQRCGIRCTAIASGNSAGVDLNDHILIQKRIQRVDGVAKIARVCGIEQILRLVEFGHQVKVSDDLAPGLLRQPGDHLKVNLQKTEDIPAKMQTDHFLEKSLVLIQGVIGIPAKQIMDGTDDVLITLCAFGGIVVLLNAQQNVQLICVLLL